MSMGPYWQVSVALPTGDVRRLRIRAADADSARLISGVRQEHIVKVARDWLGPLLESAPPLRVQSLVVTQIAAKVASSSDLDAVPELVRQHPALRIRMERSGWTPDSPLSELFDSLGFDPVVTALVRTGQKTGRLFGLLKDARRYLSSAQALARSNIGHIVMGLILGVLGILGTIGLPHLLGTGLDKFAEMSAAGLAVQTTFATDILIWLRDGGSDVIQWTVLGLLAAGVVAWYQADQWITDPTWQGAARPFQYFRRAKRGAVLLSMLQPLYAAGVDVDDMLDLLRQGMGEPGKALAAALHRGLSLSESLRATAHWWSPALVHTLQDVEYVRLDARDLVFESSIEAMLEEQADVQKNVAIGVYFAGGAIGLSMILLIALGFMLPNLSIGA